MSSDTSEEVKQLQLQMWLAKSPGERLRLTLETNDVLYSFWNAAKKAKKDLPQKEK